MTRAAQSPDRSVGSQLSGIGEPRAEPGVGLRRGALVEALARRCRTGIMDEPMMRAYMPYRTASEVYPTDTPGRWVAETSWPSPQIKPRTWYLDARPLDGQDRGAERGAATSATNRRTCRSRNGCRSRRRACRASRRPTIANRWCSTRRRSTADLEILGHPVARIRVAADQPVAKLALRLCEVTPEGKSWLVTYGLLQPHAPGRP